MSPMSGVHAVVGLSGLTVERGGYSVQHDQILKVPLPAAYERDRCDRIRRDFDILAEVVGQYPDEFSRLHEAAMRSDFQTASQIARQIGLTEDRFLHQGGGALEVAAGIAIVLLIVVLGSSGSEPTPAPPQPPPPETTLPPPDAGVPPDAGGG